ncbi:hypothetical protein GIX45_07875 [Erwinia sp. CPCC 100877]|nr:hypothetical protein [Erwinia sp. CPCC 100877]
MRKVFLLNREVEFYPCDNILLNTSIPDRSIVLPSSSARCLQLLLEKKETVTHKEFYLYVWKDNADQIMANNLYQSISLLRKSLRACVNNGHNWIITVPRKGFRLHPEIEVNSISSENKISPEGNTNDTVKSAVCDKDTSTTSIKTMSFIHRAILFSLPVTLIAAYFLVAITPRAARTQFADDLIFYQEYGSCKIYINRTIQNDFSYNKKLFPFVSPDCHHSPYIYITAQNSLPLSSIIACEKEINSKKPNCNSILIKKAEKE